MGIRWISCCDAQVLLAKSYGVHEMLRVGSQVHLRRVRVFCICEGGFGD